MSFLNIALTVVKQHQSEQSAWSTASSSWFTLSSKEVKVRPLRKSSKKSLVNTKKQLLRKFSEYNKKRKGLKE